MRLNMLAVLLALALTLGGHTAFAQEAAPATFTDPALPMQSIPESARLEGLRPVYQLLNRCSAAALTINLSYFGWEGSYTDTIRALNPHDGDVAVRLDEMIGFAQSQGLGGIARIGGTLDLLKVLVANGFPVLIENSYYDGADAFRDWMSHNRVVMGYDDAQGVILTFDPLLGNGPDNTGRPIPYADVDDRWRPLTRAYIVLYRPEDEARLQQVMGDHWDPNYGVEQTIARSEAEIAEGGDTFSKFNLGVGLTLAGRYEEAVPHFDEALGIGLPFRMLWYFYEPFEAYYQTGQYQRVIDLARATLADLPRVDPLNSLIVTEGGVQTGIEEIYYYAGLAYEALGDLDSAKANYEIAAWRNSNFVTAREALARVNGG